MENAKQVLKETGLLESEEKEERREVVECSICFEESKWEDSCALGCKHRYCVICWREYLHFKVEKGGSCIYAECMKKGCKQLCHQEFYKRVVDKPHFERYNFFLDRSFVEDNPRVKYCPFPACSFAIKCEYKDFSDPVTCRCGFTFWLFPNFQPTFLGEKLNEPKKC